MANRARRESRPREPDRWNAASLGFAAGAASCIGLARLDSARALGATMPLIGVVGILMAEGAVVVGSVNVLRRGNPALDAAACLVGLAVPPVFAHPILG